MRPLQLSLFESTAQSAAPAEAPRAPELALAPESHLRLAEGLSALLREPVEVELTDNAWTMVSYKREQGRLRFRLHHMFGSASLEVVRAIAGFTGRARKQAGRAIDDYIRAHRHLIKQQQKAEPELEVRGRVYDLRAIYDALNAAHFEGRVDARIGWGRRAPGRKRRSIKMGVYFHERKLIKIHPALDDARVPRHFVEAVVFHEMLHQMIPPSVDASGRRSVHGPAFQRAERAFPHYQSARAWEKANIGFLLRQRA